MQLLISIESAFDRKSDNPRVGMEQKAAEFRSRGSKLYHPAKED